MFIRIIFHRQLLKVSTNYNDVLFQLFTDWACRVNLDFFQFCSGNIYKTRPSNEPYLLLTLMNLCDCYILSWFFPLPTDSWFARQGGRRIIYVWKPNNYESPLLCPLFPIFMRNKKLRISPFMKYTTMAIKQVFFKRDLRYFHVRTLRILLSVTCILRLSNI